MDWQRIVSIAVRTGFVGLVTNVACSQAPAGALLEAENVVIRRPGCVEPRDGVKSLASPGSYAAWGFSTVDSDVYAKYSGGSFTWKTIGGSSIQYTDPVSGAVDPQPFRRDVLSHAELRGNVYVPYTAGVLRLDAATPEFTATGLPPYVTFNATPSALSASGTWLPNTSSVGYRLVTKRTDANGMDIRSIPSGATYVTNTAGAARAVTLNLVYDAAFNGLFDEVEVYRTSTFASGTAVDDEMQLVGVVPVSSFSFSGTYNTYYVAFDDLVGATSRGATLYTSPSRGGLILQNERPPAAACVAAFKGSLFFGNVRGPFRTQFSYKNAGAISAATGIGSRTYTGDTTSGNNTILNLSSTTGLEKGMVLENNFPSNAYITNISGTTVTMSQNATATGVGASLTFYDAINVDGIWAAIGNVAGQSRAPAWLASFGTGEQIAYAVTPPKGGYTDTYVVETISRASGTAPTIKATHGSEYDPPLPSYSSTAEDYGQDVYPGMLMWSKTDEPEHVAPVNYAFVGDKSRAILGLVPTRDALFVLKEDGVWRLTGVNGVWRIDPYDPTTRCVLPSSVQPLNGRAYFLSNRGVVAFGDSGSELVSGPVNDLVKPLIDQARRNFVTNGYYELGSNSGATVIGSTAAVYARESEYTLMRDTDETPLVFNEARGAWTSWKYEAPGSESISYKAVFAYEREGRVCYSLGADLYGTRLSTDSQLGTLTLAARNDRETAITISSASGTTLTASATLTALADDVVQDAAGVLWRITADVSGSATVYVDSLNAYPAGAALAFTTGSCVLYRSLRCRVAPQTFTESPVVPKCHDIYTAAFTELNGPMMVRYAYSSQMTPLAVDAWDTVDAVMVLNNGRSVDTVGWAYSGRVPNAHARAWMLNAGVRWVMTHGNARLEGLYLETREMLRGANQQVAG